MSAPLPPSSQTYANACLRLSATIEAVALKTNIKTNIDNLSTTTNRIKELGSNITNVTSCVDHRINTFDDEIYKPIDTKLQVSFSEAVGSQNLNTIATEVTVAVIKSDDYLKGWAQSSSITNLS